MQLLLKSFLSPRARMWFNGAIALSGSIATGSAVLAAQVPSFVAFDNYHLTVCLKAMGADFGYVGSAFIATHEARASEEYVHSPPSTRVFNCD